MMQLKAEGFSLPFVLLMAFALMAATVGFYPMITKHIIKSKQYMNAHAEMEIAETMIRLILSNPVVYSCTSTGGVPNCTFQSSADSPLPGINSPTVARVILNAANKIGCIPGQNCQIQVIDGGSIYAATGGPKVRLRYSIQMEGLVALSSNIDIPLPKVSLLSKLTPCNGILRGINDDGSANCVPIDPRRAPVGQYISAIDPNTYQVTFSSVPGNVADCVPGGNRFIMSYSWSGGPTYQVNCENRLDPAVFP